jgi:ribosomal protein L32
MNDAFNCSECGHSITRHTITKWMQFSKVCEGCACAGFKPNYRKGDNT